MKKNLNCEIKSANYFVLLITVLDTGFNANINKHQDENKNGVLVSDNSQQLICALRVCWSTVFINCDSLACKSV